MERRTALKWIMHSIGGISAAIVAIPSAVTLLSPALRRQKEEVWRSVGSTADFPVGQTVPAAVKAHQEEGAELLRRKGVYVWQETPGGFVVFSRSCTDLGCPVNWDPGSEVFFCPCHGGIFAKDGERMAGPPKRALYRYNSRIRNNELEIDLRSVPPMV
jgi:menaquinol-cytochrome c reductase iron-sulfur subunit